MTRDREPDVSGAISHPVRRRMLDPLVGADRSVNTIAGHFYMKQATKRSILRWIHIVFTIPILGYIYGPASEVEQYAGAARFLFVPVLILSGYWMYAGVVFGIIGVAAWLGANYLSGFGAAVLSQVALFIGRKIWLVIRARRSRSRGIKTPTDSTAGGNGAGGPALSKSSRSETETERLKTTDVCA